MEFFSESNLEGGVGQIAWKITLRMNAENAAKALLYPEKAKNILSLSIVAVKK